MMVILVMGVSIMDGKVNDVIIAIYAVVLTLAGMYILFALKVARQWEKAVVLRLGVHLIIVCQLVGRSPAEHAQERSDEWENPNQENNHLTSLVCV
jgi:hypothetical protein